MKKTGTIVVMLVLILCNLAFGGLTESEKKTNKNSLSTAIVFKKSISPSILATGSVKSIIGAEVKVGARISGRVEHLYANIGDKVEAGQVIGEIEKKDLEAQVAMAEANLKAAEASSGAAGSYIWPVLSAEANYGYGNNYTQQSVSNEKFVGVKLSIPILDIHDIYAAKQAESMVESARAALEYAKVQLSYATIHAPIPGIIASVSTQEGETVAAGLNAPTFVTIIDLSRLQVDAFVDETDIGRVKNGQKAIFTVDTYPSTEFTGHVSAIYPKAVIQENVVNYDVVIKIDDIGDKILRPDMTTSVTIFQKESIGALLVPRSAVAKNDNGKYVLIQQPSGVFEKRTVKTGVLSGNNIEVISGLKEGDVVALNP